MMRKSLCAPATRPRLRAVDGRQEGAAGRPANAGRRPAGDAGLHRRLPEPAGLTAHCSLGSTGRVTFPSLSHLECSRDGSEHDADVVQGTSPLGAPLLARYDLPRAAETVTRGEIASRPPTLWRYPQLLPVRDAAHVVSLGEGMTPLLDLPVHGARLGVPVLRMKDEGLVPTGAFKARGAAV